MPELPEVETVRRGLAPLAGRTVAAVEVRERRSVREHIPGPRDFSKRLIGQQFRCVSRRGKFLWLPTMADEALVVHLGMSGQARLQPAGSQPHPHCRVRIAFESADFELHFTDQRMFGGMLVDELVDVDRGERLPQRAAHIARDLLDPHFDLEAAVANLRRRQAGIKSLLLNQQIASGLGNIYADEALWAARLHYAKPAAELAPAKLREVLTAGQEVMRRAVVAGGTSFDSLYVNAAGEPGWFRIELAAYGREGEACPRCGSRILREAWANRSSFRCPRCQRAPRR